MDKSKILTTLSEIMRDLIDEDSVVLKEETTAKDVEGWDSLTHISFISLIEEEFDIKFEMKDVVGMKNVGDLVAIIMRESEN